MSEPDVDERLEAHLRWTLQEVARTTPRVITPFSDRRRPAARRHLMSIAAATLLLVGVAGLFVVARGGEDTLPTADSIPEAVSESVPMNPSDGSLLTSPVAADVQALVGIDRSGWRVAQGPLEGQGGFARPTVDCPGCAAQRLVLVADDAPLLGGALFTAWTLDASYDIDQLDIPVNVGPVEGRAKERDGVNVDQARVMVAWPLADGRTAFVDAVGLSTEQVVDMAAGLRFDATVPAFASLPDGFRQLAAPPVGVLPSEPTPGASAAILIATLADDTGRTVRLYGTNQGVHGLLDWTDGVANLLLNDLRPITVAGTTIAVEESPRWPTGRFGAFWVAGEWGYHVLGDGFGTRDEFIEVVADLELTDEAGMALEETTEMFDSAEFSYSTGWALEDQP